MTKNRLEAFSDGVITIITIMVLGMKVPYGAAWAELSALGPVCRHRRQIDPLAAL